MSKTYKVADLIGARFGSLSVTDRRGTAPDGRKLWACRCCCGADLTASTKALRTGATTACPSCRQSSSRSPLAIRLSKWKLAPSGCHEWTGRRNELGYGRIIVEGIETRAHRAMFFMLNPDADRSLVVMHSCDNPCCVNPAHLELGTVRDNMWDMHAKGRFNGGAKPGNRSSVGNKGWLRRAEAEGRLIEHMGQRRCLVHWADQYGVPRGTVVSRVRAGWPVEKAFTTPARQYRRNGSASKFGETVELP